MTNLVEFLIRPATPSDAEVLADLSARTFIFAYQAMLPIQALLDNIRKEMGTSGNRFLLTNEGETPVGYVLLLRQKLAMISSGWAFGKETSARSAFMRKKGSYGWEESRSNLARKYIQTW